MTSETIVAALVCSGLTGAVAFAYFRLKERALRAELSAREQESREKSRRESEAFVNEARLKAIDELNKARMELERALGEQRSRLDEAEGRITDRERVVSRQLDRFAEQETELRQRGELLESARAGLEREREVLRQTLCERRAQLEGISQLNTVAARTLLLKEVEQEAAKDAADLTRRITENARTNAEQEARRIITIALQRYAGAHTFETTTATVSLTGDDMKGRIIGREGRNIRAFEAATGVTVLVDDTPNAVVLSGFDPVRREVARQAMERLILDGRIHPTRIEEVVGAVNLEMDSFIGKTGENATFRAGISPLHPDIARTLGKLYFRHSFSQNVLEHCVEVAHLCGLMAAELGEDIQIAKRAGLLHDIGKAMTHEIEGPHAIVGANFLKQLGESPEIINAVASHHEEVPHENLFGVLVSAADAISASRPGSRSESMTTYIKRLENLEQIARNFGGVEKAFAVQAGRELRVVVRPEQLDDHASLKLARDIARKIEDELLYPGQIRITVVRETRCVEFAK